MTIRLSPYPAYKDSGVEWLGQIPRHWELRRTKSFVENVNDQVSFADSDDLYLALEHVESWTGHVRNTQRNAVFESQVKRFNADDVLFGKLRPYLAKVTRPQVKGVCVSEFFVLRRIKSILIPAYIEQLLRSKPVIDMINASTFGAKMPRADWNFVGNLRLAFPPYVEEQETIVQFLQRMDSRVNRLIRRKRRFIELLNEQKQALIYLAVTRGLDSDASLKPSGIDWLGDIPAHWNVQRNGSLFFERIERGDPEWPILIVSLRTGITIGGTENTDGRPRRLIEDRSSYKKAVKGDIAYNMMRMWQGALGVSPVDGLVSPAYVVAAPRPGANAQFFAYLYRTAIYKSEVNRASTGIVSDRNRLYWDNFKNLPAPVPPFAEQCCIVAMLEQEHARIDKAISRTQQEVDLIREYRTRLIAEVVTGKLDVRGVAFPHDEDTAEWESIAGEMEEAVDDEIMNEEEGDE